MTHTKPGPLIVIWDNGPAHGGDVLRTYLATLACGCAWFACPLQPRLQRRRLPLHAGAARLAARRARWGGVRGDRPAVGDVRRPPL